MQNIKLDLSGVESFVEKKEIEAMNWKIERSFNFLKKRDGLGNEFLGWLNLPKDYDRDEFYKIQETAKKIRGNSNILIVIGIGGSYLGAKAAIEFLGDEFKNYCSDFNVFFAGNNLSPNYIKSLLKAIDEKDVSLNVISKSGTTLEPAISFRIFREHLIDKYGIEEARKRIYVTTDKSHGSLKRYSIEQGYETFVIPDDIGGRYSVLTSVGLLPICICGYKIDEIMLGAECGMENYLLNDNNLSKNISCKYAAIRNILFNKNKNIEIIVNYDPELKFFTEWWKQLFGESEGKNHKGIFPASLNFSTDLHSMGQYIQDGSRNIFETVLCVENSKNDIAIKEEENNLDGLNFLNGKTLDFVNKKVFKGTRFAHIDGGVPNLAISLKKLDEFTFGELIYFFEVACAVSAYSLDVNPFDQPGVEMYKKNMLDLLEKF
ncbi:MAG: glucose-6-phosphate isomerase [Clostridiales bacterium]|jgi:glucose-6-phosphate isomerase|nr:glucose-6-phosphate isomerase [Clostridiales bacterium]